VKHCLRLLGDRPNWPADHGHGKLACDHAHQAAAAGAPGKFKAKKMRCRPGFTRGLWNGNGTVLLVTLS